MKAKKLLIGIAVVLFVGVNYAPAVTITWHYNNSTQGSWEYQPGSNEHSGYDFWCVANGTDCGFWDWKSIYLGISSPSELDPSVYSVAYGHDNVLQASAVDPGIAGPGEFQYPGVEISSD